jgi:hypothetical protein
MRKRLDSVSQKSLDGFRSGVIVHYNTTQAEHHEGTAMKVSAVVTVLIASFTFVAGAALESATREAPKAAAAPSAHAAAPKVAPERVAHLVVLPEVTVRPSAEDLALAYAEPVADTDIDANTVPHSPARSRAGASRGAFDMPYYSFGKVLPQVSQD